MPTREEGLSAAAEERWGLAEAREGGASVSSPSSSAKLRSFGGYLALAKGEEEGGLMLVLVVAVEGGSLASSLSLGDDFGRT